MEATKRHCSTASILSPDGAGRRVAGGLSKEDTHKNEKQEEEEEEEEEEAVAVEGEEEEEGEEDVDWQVQLTFSFPHFSVPTLFGRERGLPHFRHFLFFFFYFIFFSGTTIRIFTFFFLFYIFYFLFFFFIIKEKKRGAVVFARARTSEINSAFIGEFRLRAALRFCLEGLVTSRRSAIWNRVNGRLTVNNLFSIEINWIQHFD